MSSDPKSFAPRGFFAYPSQPPLIPETISEAVRQINNSKRVHLSTWQELTVSGKLVIDEICAQIDKCQLFLADLTGLNLNVLFEVGYAIAKNKRIWNVLDTSISGSAFNELRTLSTIGYVPYSNSEDIIKSYFHDSPHNDLSSTLFASLVTSSDGAGGENILYLKSQQDTNASVQITKRLNEFQTRMIVDDPREAPFQTLTWYCQHVSQATGVVCHLTNPQRQGALLRNARYALVAGMAYGLDKRVLMLTEGDYLAPLDYRDMLQQYQTAAAAARQVDSWLRPIEDAWQRAQHGKGAESQRQRLATELQSLRLGEFIAENENDQLVDGYFVETAAYRDALTGTGQTIFVGRKGAGKSANFLQLAATLQTDPRNIVSVIKPVAYELESILRLLQQYKNRDEKGYAIESLWKFLLYSDIAHATAVRLRARLTSTLAKNESDFITFFETNKTLFAGDFSSRLEHCVTQLNDEDLRNGGVERTRHAISESLHAGLLRDLRTRLTSVLTRGMRIAIIIDNLDKAWDRQQDLYSLAEFLLGLLGAANKVRAELRKDIKTNAEVTLAVFLRADIFEKVQQVAREPDKINYSRLSWADPELLFSLIEERYAGHGDDVRHKFWSKFFCPTVDGFPTKDFLAQSVLPRPRDFIYFIKTAVAHAINRRHPRVEEADVLAAYKDYSEFAFGIICIEDNSGRLEPILYEFAGASAELTRDEVCSRLRRAGMDEGVYDSEIAQLCALTFLGVEVGDGDFRYPESLADARKVTVLTRQRAEQTGQSPRYRIHPAFRPFLEVVESDPRRDQ